MPKTTLEGSFCALITPFNADGSVDHEGFRTWIDFHHEHGTSALLLMGSTGEVSLLSWEERRRIIRQTVRFRRPGMPLYYGCTGNSTESTIEMVRHAGAEGADGAIITIPSYICPPVEDAVTYYLEVADASPIPIGIYNNPTRVKTDLPAEAVLRLAKHENIVILKESTSRVAQIAQVAAGRPDMAVMCCDSPNLGLVMPVMSLGGQGTANMTGNIAPRELAAISKPWASFADAQACRETYLRLLPLLFFTYSTVNPIPVKSLARALGMPAGDLRRPYRALQGGDLERGLRIVRELGLAETYGYSRA
ncbi:MAG: 4-hydroxy-tetrahydrodipicolinate synthase [Thermoleophilia bacterium]|nr:4-hydroxy-tetrahydrodipicolinate synthase [Thermoleophilia bacterium]